MMGVFVKTDSERQRSLVAAGLFLVGADSRWADDLPGTAASDSIKITGLGGIDFDFRVTASDIPLMSKQVAAADAAI